MRFILQTLKELTAIFGFTAFTLTIAYTLVYNGSLLTDDPYLIGFIASIFVVPGCLIYFIVRQYPNRLFNKHGAFFSYSILPIVLFSIIEISGGEGSGYGFLIGKFYLASLILTVLILSHLEKPLISRIFLSMGGVYFIGYSLWWVRYYY